MDELGDDCHDDSTVNIVLSILILCSPSPHGYVIYNAWLLSWRYPGIHIIVQPLVDSFVPFCRALLYSSTVFGIIIIIIIIIIKSEHHDNIIVQTTSRL